MTFVKASSGVLPSICVVSYELHLINNSFGRRSMQLELETNKDAFIYCLLLIVIGVASVLIWFRPWTSTVRLDIFHFMR